MGLLGLNLSLSGVDQVAKTEIIGGVNSLKQVLIGKIFSLADEIFLLLKPEVIEFTRSRLREELKNSPTIISLLGSDFGLTNLKIQFGLTDENALESVDKIIDAVVESVDVSVVLGKNSTSELGVLTITIAPDTFQEQLGLRFGRYISPPSGHEVAWLEWLLTKGATVVVEDYKLVLRDYGGKSRSGGGLMRKSSGGFYRVDSQHAGTVGDNFITRAIENITPDIIYRLEQLVRQL